VTFQCLPTAATVPTSEKSQLQETKINSKFPMIRTTASTNPISFSL
jgi:hypothetical protein